VKIRLAMKIQRSIGTPRQSSYTGAQIGKALDRIDRWQRDRRYAYESLDGIGAVGQERLLGGKR
jgi:hypothetical protein